MRYWRVCTSKQYLGEEGAMAHLNDQDGKKQLTHHRNDSLRKLPAIFVGQILTVNAITSRTFCSASVEMRKFNRRKR